MASGQRLEAIYFWGKRALDYRLLVPGERLAVGPSKRASLVAPDAFGLPAARAIVEPTRSGCRLRLWPGMAGKLRRATGNVEEVSDLLAAPAPKRWLGAPAYRETPLAPGDGAEILVDPASGLRLRLGFVDAPESLPRQRVRTDALPFLRTAFGTSTVALAVLLVLLVVGNRLPDKYPPVITPERYAKVIAPVVTSPALRAAEQQARAAAERERQRREREAAEAARMKNAEGKLGRADATRKDTVLPKGREDVLREKVAKTGLLAALGSARASGSGLGRLFNTDTSAEMDQALTGLEGARLAVGRGSGGLGFAGSGPGGGGTGFGRIQGTGDLDVGAGRGRGRKGPNLGGAREKEVQVGFETGSPDAEGGLTKEQINRVVRAHAAAVKYCFEKELQRAPQLAGKIELFWVIRADGGVDRARVAKTTMGSPGVESCIERQVKNWLFPRSNADTIVQSYPFLFKGGT